MAASTVDEQVSFRAAVRQFATSVTAGSTVRKLLEDDRGYDPAAWQQACRQLELAGLTVPEVFGGSGLGLVELVIACEELGAALHPSPFLGTVVLAGQALVGCADEGARQRWLPGMVDGSRTATLALTDGAGGSGWSDIGPAWSDMGTIADYGTDGWRLTGAKDFVVDGHTADLLLVVGRTDDGLALFAVDPASPGVTARRRSMLDSTRRMARLELRSVPAERISGAGDVTQPLAAVLDRIRIALAAEQIGGARRCLDMAVEHARLRVQFDRPIGSFQAIKHQLADLLVQIEAARSAVLFAAGLADVRSDSPAGSDSGELPIAAVIAQLCCADAYTAAAKRNIQVHGGIGYTWEHDAHLYLRRAKSSQLLYGTPAELRGLVAARLADSNDRPAG